MAHRAIWSSLWKSPWTNPIHRTQHTLDVVPQALQMTKGQARVHAACSTHTGPALCTSFGGGPDQAQKPALCTSCSTCLVPAPHRSPAWGQPTLHTTWRAGPGYVVHEMPTLDWHWLQCLGPVCGSNMAHRLALCPLFWHLWIKRILNHLWPWLAKSTIQTPNKWTLA